MDDLRLFLCAWYQCEVGTCSRCDCGQRYRGTVCSGVAHSESLRAAVTVTLSASGAIAHLVVVYSAKERLGFGALIPVGTILWRGSRGNHAACRRSFGAADLDHDSDHLAVNPARSMRSSTARAVAESPHGSRTASSARSMMAAS